MSFQAEGQTPVGNATAEELAQYDAWYADPSGEKILYLTFDAGYENGCTAPILDTLKKHQVPAAFFVVGHFLETSPELVKRMVNEGHTVANHTFHHPDMSKISSLEAFQSELSQTEALYEKITGQPMAKYYRPAPGKIQRFQLKNGKGAGLSDLFLEPGLRGLVPGRSALQRGRPLKSFWAGSIRAPSSCFTALPPPTRKF